MQTPEKNTVLRTHAPLFDRLAKGRRKASHETWHFKLNDPASGHAFSVRFQVLVSANGFRKVSEVWAVSFWRSKETKEISKTALKQSFDLEAFSSISEGGSEGVRIGSCELTSTRTRGSLVAKGQKIEWDLKMAPATSESGFFNLVPESLNRIGILGNQAITIDEDLRFSGTTSVDGVIHTWEGAPGMQGHRFGSRSGHSWTWGHCNAFVSENGSPSDTVFEGLAARSRLIGHLPSPRLSSFYFRYRGEEFRFNSVWDSIHSRSQHSLDQWSFRAERGELSFRGKVHSEYRDFAGLTYEDTDGSLLYCADSRLSEMTLLVYRRGKLEATLTAKGTAAFQIVSRARNPYVPLLI